MIQPNLVIPVAVHYLSHFLKRPFSLLFLLCPLATITSFISFLSLSLLYRLWVPLHSSFLTLFVPHRFALLFIPFTPYSAFFPLGPLFFFNHFISITHRLRGRWEAQGTESIRFWCHTLWLALTPWGKVCTCPFASDRRLAKIHLHLLLGPDSLQETCVSISLYVHVSFFYTWK